MTVTRTITTMTLASAAVLVLVQIQALGVILQLLDFREWLVKIGIGARRNGIREDIRIIGEMYGKTVKDLFLPHLHQQASQRNNERVECQVDNSRVRLFRHAFYAALLCGVFGEEAEVRSVKKRILMCVSVCVRE